MGGIQSGEQWVEYSQESSGWNSQDSSGWNTVRRAVGGIVRRAVGGIQSGEQWVE